MKKEYDFSNGVRGKFFNAKAKIHLPIYLEPDIEEFIRTKAEQNNQNTESLVNQLLRKDIENLQILS